MIHGHTVPFSRNDPILASLEMIGAIRATHPCRVRNLLYARALRRYYGQPEEAGQAALPSVPEVDRSDDIGAMHARVSALRTEALGPSGTYMSGRAWETYAASLFSMVPAFSMYPHAHADRGNLDVILTINSDMPGGVHWGMYKTDILVEARNLGELAPETITAELVKHAATHSIGLVFVMTASDATVPSERRHLESGVRDELCIVSIRDAEIVDLLEKQGDLDAFLRDRVLAARLRRI